MAQILTFQEWLKLTDGGFASIRSSQLKAVDEALKQYHAGPNEATLGALQGALLKWMQSKGAGWKTSVRNKRNAVDTLYKQVTGVPGVKKTALGMIALSHARDESRAIVTALFQGKQLVYRPGIWSKLAGPDTLAKVGAKLTVGGIVKETNTLSGGAIADGIRKAPGQIGQAIGVGGGGKSSAAAFAEQIFRDIVPSDIVGDVTKGLIELLPNFMQQWVASLTPFAGVIISGGKVVKGAVMSLRAQWRVHDAQVHAERSLSTEEPAQAIEAIVRMLERERNGQLAGLAVGVAEFGGKLAGVLADGGTATNAAVGLAAGVANLAILIHAVIRDVREKNAANKLMAMARVGTSLFEACPLMGAYMVCCVPTSVLVNTIFDDDKFYEHGMMDRVERAVSRHINPLKEQARRLTGEHRMYIPALQNFPGMLAVNKDKLKAMLERKGKSTIGMDHFGSGGNG